MEKTALGLAVALGVGSLSGAQAATPPNQSAAELLRVASVAELLDPVPNSPAVLAALDADPTSGMTEQDRLQVAQWHHHHHHHHHHHFWHHHHHHHHHWHWRRHHHWD